MAVKDHNKLLVTLLLIALGMFGFGFALVPIYNSLCKALNINGKTNTEAIAYNPHTKVNQQREVLVQFVATQNSSIPWAFYPKVEKIKFIRGKLQG
ncbi:cytochrome c oxidase assembly protein (plasmid) [Legionella adelaidensis]|uniref:Cytochrome c oxidase assembly protein CtaG n=1 Tax=Legionella adelaidensis TaxID=45056 RepID=A0A448NE62_9GAMM|nr:cytochrome c oxidase assembly protein [Legionella adelaidensis]